MRRRCRARGCGGRLRFMQIDRSWTGDIEALVGEANTWLERLLPAARSGRGRELNPRLVRHYTTERLVSAPERRGRQAWYHSRHLLELLALRRLMADGVGGRALALALEDRRDDELWEVASGGSTAMEGRPVFGWEVEEEREEVMYSMSIEPPPPSVMMLRDSAPEEPGTGWQEHRSLEVHPGITLQVSEWASAPGNDREWAALMRRIERELRGVLD